MKTLLEVHFSRFKREAVKLIRGLLNTSTESVAKTRYVQAFQRLQGFHCSLHENMKLLPNIPLITYAIILTVNKFIYQYDNIKHHLFSEATIRPHKPPNIIYLHA